MVASQAPKAGSESLVLQEALKLLKRGFSVVPLGETHKPSECNDEDDRLPHTCPDGAGVGSKRPTIATWKEYQERLPTENEVRSWFENNPERGLAIVCGPVSAPPGKSLAGVDSDGPLSMNELVGGPNGMPGKLCLIDETGREGGGNHTLFFVNDSDKKKTHTHVKGERVDIQTKAAIIAVYPTVHPKTAKRYKWLNYPEKLFDAEQTIEQWFAARGHNLRGKRCPVCYPETPATQNDVDDDGVVVTTESGYLLRDLQNGVFRQGGRHDACAEFAGFVVGKLGGTLALPIVKDWNASHCKPPLPDDEVHALVEYCDKEDKSKEKESGDMLSLAEVVDNDFGSVSAMLKNPSLGRGMSTGYSILDGQSLGIHRGKTVTLAARPGVGKTAMAFQLAVNLGIEDYTSIFFSMEMSRTDLLKRAIGTMGGINLHKVLSGEIPLSDDVQNKAEHAASLLRSLPIFIDDTSGLSPEEIIRRTVKLRRKRTVHAMFVDYLHLLGKDPGKTYFSRENEISDAVVQLAGYGKKHGIAIILLSQLNRMTDHRQGGIPQLSDLRDSGMIEQRSDMVWMLFKVPKPDIVTADYEQQIGLFIGKSKDGPAGNKVIFAMRGPGRKIEQVRLDIS